MGNFVGHSFPGIFSLLFGLRWTYCFFRRFFLCRRDQALTNGESRRYKSSITYPVSCCPKFPIEAAVILVIVVIGSIGELYQSVVYGFLNNSHHISMYFFIGFAALMIVLKHFRFSVLPDAEYACFILSLSLNIFVLQRHTHGKPTLEMQVHQNKMLVTLFIAVVMALEMKYRHNPLLPVIRGIGFSLHGSWSIMIGYILFWPWGGWAREDPMSIMMNTISLMLHIAVHLLLACLIGAVALVRVRSLDKEEVSLVLDREGLDPQKKIDYKISSNSEGKKYLLLNSDDEA